MDTSVNKCKNVVELMEKMVTAMENKYQNVEK